MSLASIGKGLFTAGRILDAGMSMYVVTDEIWTAIDWKSRYPGLRDLVNEMTDVGLEYDTDLESLINESRDLTNISTGLIILNQTVQHIDDQGTVIFKRYEALEKQRQSLELKYPTLRDWFDSSWIKLNIKDSKSLTQLQNHDNTSLFGKILSYGFMGLGAGLSIYKVVMLTRQGMSAFRKYRNRNNPVVATRPRANAIVEPTGRIARLKHRWTMFKVRHPKVYKSMQAGALVFSFGLNLYLIINKANAISKQKEFIEDQINTMKEGRKNITVLRKGTSDENDLLAVVEYYDLDVDSNDQEQREELMFGIEGLLKNSDENIKSCTDFIDETYEQLVEDAEVFNVDEQKELDQLKQERANFKQLKDELYEEKDGAKKKKLIEEISEHTRNKLVSKFADWIDSLDLMLEVEKMNILLANKADRLIKGGLSGVEEDSEEWKKIIKEAADEQLEMFDLMFPERPIYKSLSEISETLTHLIKELMVATLAA